MPISHGTETIKSDHKIFHRRSLIGISVMFVVSFVSPFAIIVEMNFSSQITNI